MGGGRHQSGDNQPLHLAVHAPRGRRGDWRLQCPLLLKPQARGRRGRDSTASSGTKIRRTVLQIVLKCFAAARTCRASRAAARFLIIAIISSSSARSSCPKKKNRIIENNYN
jgi:hypothetical protein